MDSHRISAVPGFRRVAAGSWVVLLCCTGFHSWSADWPHWLGPNGDNRVAVSGEFPGDLSRWSEAWKAEVGKGYSAVSVAGPRAITLGHDGEGQETVYCFEAASGKVLWKQSYEAQLLPRMHPGGPNATATVEDDRVYTVSKDGQVSCRRLADGAEVWKANLGEVMGIKLPNWGFGTSPVIDGDRVLFNSAKVAALDRATGRTLWTSANEHHPGYATPVVFERDGARYIAALDGKGFSVLKAGDGAEVAHRPFKAGFDLTATTPMVLGGGSRLFISGNASSELLAFDGGGLQPVWTSTEFRNAMNNSVILGEAVYGIDGRQGTPQARLMCVGLADGQVRWAKEGFGYGTVIGVGTTLLALTENGELVTVAASPEGYREYSRRQVLGKVCWTTPVYAQGRIYVRNDQGQVICLAPPAGS